MTERYLTPRQLAFHRWWERNSERPFSGFNPQDVAIKSAWYAGYTWHATWAKRKEVGKDGR